MGVNGEATRSRINSLYVPIGSVLTTVIALLTFWITFSNQLDARFAEMQGDVRVIREVIVEHHGQLPR